MSLLFYLTELACTFRESQLYSKSAGVFIVRKISNCGKEAAGLTNNENALNGQSK
jgi:hypothetical protein